MGTAIRKPINIVVWKEDEHVVTVKGVVTIECEVKLDKSFLKQDVTGGLLETVKVEIEKQINAALPSVTQDDINLVVKDWELYKRTNPIWNEQFAFFDRSLYRLQRGF